MISSRGGRYLPVRRRIEPCCADCEEKGIGPPIGRGGRSDGFDPNARDGDGDGKEQDETIFERPATPNVSDAGRSAARRILRQQTFRKRRTVVEGDGVEQKMVEPPSRLRDMLPERNKVDYSAIRAKDALFRERLASLLEGFSSRRDPAVERAYQDLAVEIRRQFDMLPDLGVNVEFVNDDPYPDIYSMMDDIDRGRLKVLRTAVTGSHQYFSDNENDMFRAVHDVFGHAATGRGFDRHGEEAAYQAHKTMFPESMHPLLASELRAQTAYLIERGKFLDRQVGGFIPMELTKHLTGVPVQTKGTVRRTADDDNLFAIGASHHASCGRHFSPGNDRRSGRGVSEKGIGPSIGGGLRGPSSPHGGLPGGKKRPAAFDPDAEDGDGDGKRQDGTPFERLATPDLPDAIVALQKGVADADAKKIRQHEFYDVQRRALYREIEQNLFESKMAREGPEQYATEGLRYRAKALEDGDMERAAAAQARLDQLERWDANRRLEAAVAPLRQHAAYRRRFDENQTLSQEERDLYNHMWREDPEFFEREVRKATEKRDRLLHGSDSEAAAIAQADLEWARLRLRRVVVNDRLLNAVDEDGYAYRDADDGPGRWFWNMAEIALGDADFGNVYRIGLDDAEMPSNPLDLGVQAHRKKIVEYARKWREQHAAWLESLQEQVRERNAGMDARERLRRGGREQDFLMDLRRLAHVGDEASEYEATRALEAIKELEWKRNAQLSRDASARPHAGVWFAADTDAILASILEDIGHDGLIAVPDPRLRLGDGRQIFAPRAHRIKDQNPYGNYPEFLNPDALNEHFNKYMPDEFQFVVKQVAADYDYYGESYAFDFVIEDADGNQVGAGRRVFGQDHIVAELLQLDKDIEGSGIAAAHYRALVELAEAEGISEIHVHANINVGGYAWGRYGYVPDDPSIIEYYAGEEPEVATIVGGPNDGEVLDPLADRTVEIMQQAQRAGMAMTLEEAEDQARDEYREFVADCHHRFSVEGDIRGWYDFVDSPWGKPILLGTDWYGQLKLYDQTQVSRFWNYVEPRTRRRAGEKALERSRRQTKETLRRRQSNAKPKEPFVLTDEMKARMKAEPSDRDGKDAWIHAEMLRDPSMNATFERRRNRRKKR